MDLKELLEKLPCLEDISPIDPEEMEKAWKVLNNKHEEQRKEEYLKRVMTVKKLRDMINNLDIPEDTVIVIGNEVPISGIYTIKYSEDWKQLILVPSRTLHGCDCCDD